MKAPLSTYRLQINGNFSFQQVDDTVDYLHELGIDWIYAAPVLQSLPGSDHGYDVVNPFTIHPETGLVNDLLKLSGHLKKKGMGWLQDIVPNHMAVSSANILLMDVLERYDASPYFKLFDIEWNHPDHRLHSKLMLPFLSQDLSPAIQSGELKADFTAEEGMMIVHGENRYPVSAETWKFIGRKINIDDSQRAIPDNFHRMSATAANLESWQEQKKILLENLSADRTLFEAISNYVSMINNNHSELEEILSHQHICFTNWKDSFKLINYRRFFTVNALICLDMENQDNFKTFHELLISMYRKRIFNGFRIDHIDGLGDPAGYIHQLREATDRDCYIVAEKILEGDEVIPEDWHLQGTTGYDFVSIINKLVTDTDGFEALMKFYQFLVPDLASYDELVYHSKKQMLEKYMHGELDNLCRKFLSLNNVTAQFSNSEVTEAMSLFMCCFPVYRIYPDSIPVDSTSQRMLRECFITCETKLSHQNNAYEYLKKIFTTRVPDQDQQKKNLGFLKRIMQFTGPLTAKGVEDTTFYIFNHLISHNEVGDSPSIPAKPIDWFHDQMLTRSKQFPLSINAGSTHDTKRGEDVRTRINVLSEFAAEWKAHVLLWMESNRSYHIPLNQISAPTVNDEYYIYQSLLGSFETYSSLDEYKNRFKGYLIKSIREAKIHTNWDKNNEEYETACLNFIDEILKPDSAFLKNFIPFHKKICNYADVYSSIQALIKVTAPGIPDIYQGSELLDLALVDPDNRRPVDFELRKSMLKELKDRLRPDKSYALQYAIDNRSRGAEKLYTIFQTLQLRKEFPQVFFKGDYIPLYCRSSQFPVMGFCKVYRKEWIIVLAALQLSVLLEDDGRLKSGSFHGHHVAIPTEAPKKWENVLSGDIINAQDEFHLKEIFRTIPFALLKGKR